MIYITGDTHIPNNIQRLDVSSFKAQEKMSKNDYIIICGDFGGVWDGSSEEIQWLQLIEEKTFTTLFVDGNHENFDLLNKYEIKEWNGGKVHFINESIIHLMRGQVYTIDGLKFFTMGGAESIDKYLRKEGETWWKEELPSKEEYEEALDNLSKSNWKVDYVITHTASREIIKELTYLEECNELNSFFNILDKELQFRRWYFGHFHKDVDFEKHSLVYERIIEIH
ncbi:metallophosphoesterase [Clostridium sp. C8-1-8]|uniref:metallophosphoesterase family protein n=1 Tax=Clostridium sp. C8-1-8 TaxID=2698831 RepID=UPI0013689EB2|nr:metallophosphoesterase [Clostridium sp. C8-1-8]